jgi:feruloyl-CoA synthase
MATLEQQRTQVPAVRPPRPVRLGPRDVKVEQRPDGTFYLESPHALASYPAKLTERLEHWAAAAPERTFLAQRRTGGDWQRVSYRETLDAVRRIGAALITRNLSPERPILILSGNSIEHALLGLAANFVGIPYAPVSPAYALLSTDLKKLKYIFDLLTPGLVFVADGNPFRRALEGAAAPDIEIVVARNSIPNRRITQFEQLISPAGTSAAESAHQKVGPDTIAKFLFTSGSTGTPKAVINTQRMVLQPGHDPFSARLFRGRAARDHGLGAVESYCRRQPQFRIRALQWWHPLYRRRQACRRRDRKHGEESARGRNQLVFHGTEGL